MLRIVAAEEIDPGEVEYFLVTVGTIHEGRGFECTSVIDTNFRNGRDVSGYHAIRIDTTKYEFYTGQQVSLEVVSDGVLKTEDGSRTFRIWKVVPGRPVKLHD